MKKVGILTWFFGPNYGAKAQAYALYSRLSAMGYEAFIINYHPPKYRYQDLVSLVRSKKELLNMGTLLSCMKKIRTFDSFSRRYKLTSPVCSAEEIDQLGLDLVIAGSDAIFNVRHPLFTDLYYGCGIHTPKISYAASCEYLDPGYRLTEGIRDSLRAMKAVSVRDVNTKSLVEENAGVPARIDLDPTFLWDFRELRTRVPERPYILVYTFSGWDEISGDVRAYAQDHGLRIVSVGCRCAWSDRSYEAASVEAWTSAFAGASMVVTDSFHGTAFSIKSRKQFLLLGRADKSAKIRSMLESLGISRDFYQEGDSIEAYMGDRIDYSGVSALLEVKTAESAAFLRTACNGA